MFRRNERKFLTWGFHEMAFSERTSNIKCPFFNKEGHEIDSINTMKQAGSSEIPESARFWIRRYWTNSNYPKHQIYEILNSLEEIYKIDREFTLQDINNLKIPKKIKEYLIDDIF